MSRAGPVGQPACMVTAQPVTPCHADKLALFGGFGGGRSLAKFRSGPERPDPEEGGVLDSPRRRLPPMRPRIGTIGHAEHNAPLAVVNRRHLVVHQRTFEDDKRIRSGADPDLPPADLRLEDGMAE